MPVGAIGSPQHVYHNRKIQDKKACLKELRKENSKDVLALTGATIATGAAAAIAVNKIPAAKKVFTQFAKNTEKSLEKAAKIYKVLPKPVQAAIAAGGIFAAIATPIAMLVSGTKAGAIEAKYENA